MVMPPFPVPVSGSQTAVRPDDVVVAPPRFDQHPDLDEAVEDLTLSSSTRSEPLELSF